MAFGESASRDLIIRPGQKGVNVICCNQPFPRAYPPRVAWLSIAKKDSAIHLDLSMPSYDRSDAGHRRTSGMADLIFLTGGINQQFVMARPVITGREQLTGKKIGFVGDGGLNDALVSFIIEKLSEAGIEGLEKEPIP